MAEDFAEKTEAPTPRRRQEARDQGQVARSADLTAAVLLLGFLVLMQKFGGNLVMAFRSLVSQFLSAESLCDLGLTQIGQVITKAVLLAAGAAAPLFIGALVIAVLVNILQVGFHPSLKRLQPKLSALNPFSRLGRMFKGRGMMQFLMNILKLTLVAFVGYSAVHGRMAEIIATQQLSYLQIFALGAQLIYSISLRVGLLLLVLALLDWAYQKYRHEKELKMTKQEIKEEMRRMEGDPKIKSRRRQIAFQVLQQRLRNDVPKADVVVTNPTHVAIALKYDSATMHAPRVVAKGEGFIAQKIREIAIAAGVPILERKPLARAMYKMVEVGQEIPEQFYAAVAEILAYVYEITGKVRRKAG